MENKYWALIIIAILVCSTAGIILMHPDKKPDQVITICPACKICPTCEDCQDRIDYCFEECKYGFPIVGWEDNYRACLWHCFHDYGIAKIN